MIPRQMKMKIISLETFLLKIILVSSLKRLYLFLDSDTEDTRGGSKIGFGGPFGLSGVSAPYGGAFSNIPDRVGSAPATDLSIVTIYLKNNKYRNSATLDLIHLRIKSSIFHLELL